MLKYISVPVFTISFALGLFFVYIMGADLKTVYIYPTPDNINSFLYKDTADNCFKYEAKEVVCASEVYNIPIQSSII
jgi:hypothetical protein